MSTDLQDNLVKKEFRRAKAYAFEYIGSYPMSHLFNTRLKRVSELLVDFKDGHVLDVGCGPAIIGNTFRGRPVEYYGLDISEDMIKECKGKYGHDPQFIFTVGKTEELPFDNSFFDVVLCLGAFEYVLDGRGAMKEIKRILKPNGTFIVTMQNNMSPYRLWQRFISWKIVNGIHRLSTLKSRAKTVEGGKRFLKVRFILNCLFDN